MSFWAQRRISNLTNHLSRVTEILRRYTPQTGIATKFRIEVHMSEQSMEQLLGQFETHLEQVARDFSYPATPNIVAGVKQQLATRSGQPTRPTRRLAWTVLVAALAMVVLLALPAVRATVWNVVHQGVVRIFLTEPFATSTPLVTITPAASAESPTGVSPQSFLATPRPSATPISSLQNGAPEPGRLHPPLQVTLPARSPSRSLILKPSERALKF